MTQLPTEGNGESREVVVSFSYDQRAVHACIKPVRVHLMMMNVNTPVSSEEPGAVDRGPRRSKRNKKPNSRIFGNEWA